METIQRGGQRAGRTTGKEAARRRTELFPPVSERLTRLLVLILLGVGAALAVAQIVLLAVTWSVPAGQELPGHRISTGSSSATPSSPRACYRR